MDVYSMQVIPPPPEFPADPWQAFLDYMAATEGNQDAQITLGQEGQLIQRGMHKGKGVAVFTSGGDSQVWILYRNCQYMKVRLIVETCC